MQKQKREAETNAQGVLQIYTYGYIRNAELWELPLCGVWASEGESEHPNTVVGRFLQCVCSATIEVTVHREIKRKSRFELCQSIKYCCLKVQPLFLCS